MRQMPCSSGISRSHRQATLLRVRLITLGEIAAEPVGSEMRTKRNLSNLISADIIKRQHCLLERSRSKCRKSMATKVFSFKTGRNFLARTKQDHCPFACPDNEL